MMWISGWRDIVSQRLKHIEILNCAFFSIFSLSRYVFSVSFQYVSIISVSFLYLFSIWIFYRVGVWFTFLSSQLHQYNIIKEEISAIIAVLITKVITINQVI